MTATQWLRKRVNVTFDVFALSEYVLSPFGAQGRRLVFPARSSGSGRSLRPATDGDQDLGSVRKAENVFNGEYYENGFGSPGRWVIGGLRLNF